MFRRFAKVIVPVSLPQLFTYAIPETFFLSCFQGCRVVVPFGKNKLYSAVVYSIEESQDEKNEAFEIKEILEVLDEKPIITPLQLKFWDWIASYYMCPLGMVYRASVPSVLKLESETVLYRTSKPLDLNELNQTSINLLNAFELKDKEIKLSSVSKYSGKKNSITLVKKLISLGYLVSDKIIENKFKPKTVKVLSISMQILTRQHLNFLLDNLAKKASKQFEILLYIIKNSFLEFSDDGNILSRGTILRKKLQQEINDFSNSSLNTLIQKNILEEKDVEVSRIQDYDGTLQESNSLSEIQQSAFEDILKQFEEKNTVLLYGVTGSGKTEIYIRLIEKYLSLGKQVLYILPEIVLSSQIIRRLQKVFGNKACIYHSKISDNERSEIWQKLIEDQDSFSLIVGVRSSIFLPFSNLGLVIVDEEHDTSYKQSDSQPRYNARDCAIVLASLFGAKTLLGSATPSFESYFNAQTGKFGYVELSERFSGSFLPEIELVNTFDSNRKGLMKSLFSQRLLNEITNQLSRGKQVVLYRNRRGFSPYVQCLSCGWIPVCENCDVTLTYHKKDNRLVCHHCGYALDMPHTCLACGGSTLITKGFGTEKVEDEIKVFFPNANIARLDADVTTSKSRFEQIIYDFENGLIDILTGTQMVSKGFDFENLSLCGILDADTMLFFPDFRAEERMFSQIVQVSGRVGRRKEKGKVLIQTSKPNSEIFSDILSGNYKQLYARLIPERSRFAYPPFTRLIKILLKHKEESQVNYSSLMLASILRKTFSSGVLGPEFPVIARVQNYFIKEILLKISKKNYGNAAKKIISEAIDYTKSMALKPGLVISIDVDP